MYFLVSKLRGKMRSITQDKRNTNIGLGVRIGSRLTEWIGGLLLTSPKWGALSITLPNGKTKLLGSKNSKRIAYLKLNNFKLFNKIRKRGTLGFASAYMNGDIESDDLTSLFRFFLKNRDIFDQAGKGWIRRAAHDLAYHLSRANSKETAKENISEHYDLGNDFYELWLDPSMTYSSALFEDENQTLEQAQIAKYHKVADLAGVTPTSEKTISVFEIGCGWGGFAEIIAKDYQANIYGISLSKQQLKYAKARIKRLGLGNSASFNFEDYRDSVGQFDCVCSIEMIEAVGEEHWPAYFKAVYDLLKPSGLAAIQAITINESNFLDYKKAPDFIQRYIFPGGMLLTKQAMKQQGKQAGLELIEQENFGRSYAKTLALWRKNFLRQWPRIKTLGFDEKFKRKWIYYLSYCEAGFDDGVIDVGIYKYRRV